MSVCNAHSIAKNVAQTIGALSANKGMMLIINLDNV